ncbi:MAG: tetratricopeptide repeat protein [Verrucomicrobia bacterium]|nr:tetratricopeptide repeat protein [Verrucomicrobiota bacterium]MDA1065063.1 tetratricopeptide repeat protein [Verrucomicrobiota bacterium]
MRVAMVYAVVAWLMIQVSATVFPQLGIPEWAAKLVTLLLLIGFPIAIILAWAFELSPDGIKTTKSAREEQGEVPVSKKQERKRNWFSILFAAAVPTLIFGALAIFFYIRSDSSPSSLASRPPSLELIEFDKSIAVLPLANMSPDPNNAFFADGVHEDILTNLSKIRDLLVIGRTSTLQYRDTVKTLKQISTELDVRYLLEGSVRREGNQVRVTVQLIDSQKRGHVWAENYNRSLEDIFAIQAEVAQTIAEKLHAVLLPEEKAKIERRPTENQEAWDYFLQSRQLFGRDNDIPLLEKAVALDPQFAEAWAALAANRMRAWYGTADQELLTSAKFALDQAERYGQGLPDIPWAKIFFNGTDEHRNNNQEDIEYLLEALAIDPGFIEARRNLGARYAQSGRFAEAQHHLEAVLRADPFHRAAIAQLAVTYNFAGTPDKALALLEKHPEFTYAKALINYLNSGDKTAFAAVLVDEEAQAKKAILERKFRSALEQRELMESTIAKVRERTSLENWKYKQQVQCEIQIAIAYLVLGDHDKAIDILEAASKMEGPIFLNRELDVWFMFDRLRGNPRFDKLLED